MATPNWGNVWTVTIVIIASNMLFDSYEQDIAKTTQQKESESTYLFY